MPGQNRKDVESARVPPVASVIVVSDYASDGPTDWEEARALLRALAEQDFTEPFEVIVSEHGGSAHDIPEDLRGICPNVRMVRCKQSSAYQLKNEGARQARAEIVAILDADCVPGPDWLRTAVEALRNHPEAAVVSGGTAYPGRNLLERSLTIATRAYLDPGEFGSTRFISNNNAAFRRSVYLEHPLPSQGGPFAARLQSESLLREGKRLLFEPRMRVSHYYGGWRMEADVHRHMGYAVVVTRLLDSQVPYAWLTRLKYASIPLFFAARVLTGISDCLRCARSSAVRWYELPAVFGGAIITRVLEVPGMVDAFRGREIKKTAYR
jgi:cellulose synthase/poly-beta-1,6-N-acetylglucosamine synthase-like glycosyltransferase